jgi:hypothetical protein
MKGLETCLNYKCNQWAEYAAMTAAGYAKGLLCYLAPRIFPDT